MAIDRQGNGLAIVRICIGVFFLSEGLGKLRWFIDSSMLTSQLAHWAETTATSSMSRWYLQHVAFPGVQVFARLVPLGEICSGVALIGGFWTPLFALIAFLMALNFHVASGVIFKWSFLTNGYGLPVLGSTLGLALGGVRLPWSVRL